MIDLISADTLTTLAAQHDIAAAQVQIEDDPLSLLTPAFISGALSDHLKELFTSAGVTYQDALDCNRFSKLASALCDLHVIKAKAQAPAAFGVFAYEIEPGKPDTGHSINVAVHRRASDESLYFAFYEPQVGTGLVGRPLEPKTLTAQQIASCIELRFA